MNKWPIQWTTSVEYYDMEDGLQLTKHQAKEYTVIRTDKITTFNKNKTKGHVRHIKQCRNKQQGKLFE